MTDTATTTTLTLHRAPWVVPVASDPIRDGAVLVADGRIVAVGDADSLIREARDEAPTEITEWAGVVLPGLVNAHSHLQYSCMAEVGAGDYAGFEDWSNAFGVVYNRGGHDWQASARDGLEQAIRSGTTAIADIATDLPALKVLHDGRVHGIVYWELMSWLERHWVESGRNGTVELVRAAGDISIGLSPHAPYSLDTPVLRDLTVLSRELGVRRHLHLAESAWEAEYTLHGTGDLADQWRRWGLEFDVLRNGGSGLRPVPYADSLGALGEDMHIAHGIYVDAEDRAILRRTGTAVALCPRSNAVIGLDEAPIADYLREGNLISVGTDSLSSTTSLDVLGDVTALYGIARRQGYAGADLHTRLLDAVTRGGARAMGLDSGDDAIGVLESGRWADMAVLDIDAATETDLLAHIVEAGEGRCIGTLIEGELRWRA